MTLAHDVHGDGPPLLLIHGAMLDRRMWAPNMAALTERHRVVRCDLRGFGASAPPDGPYSHADDLRELLASLEIERAAVVGLSMGGGVALELALAHPGVVGALVLVDTDLPGAPLDPALREAIGVARGHVLAGDVEAAREVWLALPFFARSPDGVAAELRAIVADYTFWHWTNPNPHVWLDPPSGGRGAEVGAPTLVVWGEHESEQFIGFSRRIADDIPDSRTAVIEGAGHMSNMDAPAAFDAALLEFLAGVEPV